MEKSDLIDILESTLENRKSEIERFKEELERAFAKSSVKDKLCESFSEQEKDFKKHVYSEHLEENLPFTSKCGKCDHESEDENNLKLHVQSNFCDLECENDDDLKKHIDNDHEAGPVCMEYQCKVCSLTCKTKSKLKDHLCRVIVRNPSFCDYYTKNWIVLNRCTPIFHRFEKREIAILHCKECQENQNRCSEKFPLWLPSQEDEPGGVWHLDQVKFLQDGRINWQAIKLILGTERED